MVYKAKYRALPGILHTVCVSVYPLPLLADKNVPSPSTHFQVVGFWAEKNKKYKYDGEVMW